MTPPNIIFIILDCLRADRVLLNDNNKNLTPNITELLKNSIFFKNCISNSPWTLPSHISMFTGLYPSQNKIISKDIDKLSYKIPTLTEILKNMGYFTICFTENAWISNISGLSRGFDEYIFQKKFIWEFSKIRNDFTKKIENYLEFVDLNIKKKTKLIFVLKSWLFFKNTIKELLIRIRLDLLWKNYLFFFKYYTFIELENFSQLLKQNIQKKPFFIFFNIMAIHDPYIPIKKAIDFLGINVKEFKIIQNFLSVFANKLKLLVDININYKTLSRGKIKVLKKFYDACVFTSDIIVNKIVTILKNLDLLDNSYVIITSDHGEHLCDQLDHYLWQHSTLQSVYESVSKVPLIIYHNNLKKRTIENQVQLKDLYHTILHLTGIPENQNRYLNMKQSIINQINTNSTPEYIFGEYLKSNYYLNMIFNHSRSQYKEGMSYNSPNLLRKFEKFKNNKISPKILTNIYFVRTNQYKYIQYEGKKIEEFYNLITDPNEQFNIYNESNENYIKMKLILESFLKKNIETEYLIDKITKNEKDIIKKVINKLASK